MWKYSEKQKKMSGKVDRWQHRDLEKKRRGLVVWLAGVKERKRDYTGHYQI